MEERRSIVALERLVLESEEVLMLLRERSRS